MISTIENGMPMSEVRSILNQTITEINGLESSVLNKAEEVATEKAKAELDAKLTNKFTSLDKYTGKLSEKILVVIDNGEGTTFRVTLSDLLSYFKEMLNQ